MGNEQEQMKIGMNIEHWIRVKMIKLLRQKKKPLKKAPCRGQNKWSQINLQTSKNKTKVNQRHWTYDFHKIQRWWDP